jgi:transposase-like protein
MKDERLSVIREVVKEINSLSEVSLKFDIHSSSIKYQDLILFMSVCENFVDHDTYKEHIYSEVRKSLKEIREDLDKIEQGC